jgi:hypothetical protein
VRDNVVPEQTGVLLPVPGAAGGGLITTAAVEFELAQPAAEVVFNV